jgi:TolA-binding protein
MSTVRTFLERYETVCTSVESNNSAAVASLQAQLDSLQKDRRELIKMYAESDARRSAEIGRLHEIIAQLTEEISLLRKDLDHYRNQEGEMETLRARVFVLMAEIERQKNAIPFPDDSVDGAAAPESSDPRRQTNGLDEPRNDAPGREVEQGENYAKNPQRYHQLAEAHVSQLIAICWLAAGGVVGKTLANAFKRRR